MAKRKRGDSLGACGPKGDDDHESPEMVQNRDKKRRKLSTTPSVDPAEICFELYETIRNYRDENGRVICESLIRVPKRRSSPDYYEVVDSPIDLLRIQQRLKTEEYEDVESLTKDMHLLFDNATKYYEADSQEYKDAALLKEIYEEEKTMLCEGENEEDEGAEDLPESMAAKNVGESDEGENESGKSSPKAGGKGRKLDMKPSLTQQVSRDDDDAASTSTMNEEEGSESGSGNYSAYYEELVTAVLDLRDPHGRIICELFKKLPPENVRDSLC